MSLIKNFLNIFKKTKVIKTITKKEVVTVEYLNQEQFLIDPKKTIIYGKEFTLSMIPAYYAIDVIQNYIDQEKNLKSWEEKSSFIISILKYVENEKGERLSNQESIDRSTDSPYVIKTLIEEMIIYNHEFQKEMKELSFLKNYYSDFRSQDFVNINGYIGAIISDNKATLNELKTIYSLKDMKLMWETIVTSRYNEFKASEQAQKKAKLKR